MTKDWEVLEQNPGLEAAHEGGGDFPSLLEEEEHREEA